MKLAQIVAACGMLKAEKKLDKDVFRRDLGNLTDAYTEVANRLGLLPKTNSQIKPTLVK